MIIIKRVRIRRRTATGRAIITRCYRLEPKSAYLARLFCSDERDHLHECFSAVSHGSSHTRLCENKAENAAITEPSQCPTTLSDLTP